MIQKQYFDLVIKGGSCLVRKSKEQSSEFRIEKLDIGIVHNKIAKIGFIPNDQGRALLHANDLHILPGVIDSQVHFREPGLEHKEDLFSGTKAAALGGVTTVFEMPNTTPPTTSEEAFKKKVELAKDRLWVNCGFYVGASEENISQLKHLELLPGCVGVKLFMGISTGGLLVQIYESIEKVLAGGNRRMSIHSEDNARLEERKKVLQDNPTVHLHPVWRDEDTAFISTKRIVALAEKTGRPVHVLHVTSAKEIQFLRDHKKLVSVECTPQHLTLFAPDCYDNLSTFAQMNPPIRSKEHLLALWQGVLNGTVDVIGSDHAPHTREEKLKKYPQSPSGMTGVQTLLPIMLDHVNSERLSLEHLMPLISYNPARLFGLMSKGLLEEGFDADITIVDMKARRTITNEWIASKCGWTPFNGKQVTGWPRYTIVGGQIVMQEDQVQGSPIGVVPRFS